MKKFIVGLLLVLVVCFGIFMLLLGATATGPYAGVAKGISKMSAGLIIVWIFLGGGLMYHYRDRVRRFIQRIPLDWRVKFVLFATFLALVEEAITTTLTNMASLFGSRVGEAFITSSANYFDVIFLHSVFPVILPLIVAWVILISRYDFKPFSVFLLFGILGVACEVSFIGPSALFGFPMWIFVYGLMVYLPAYCCIPNERNVRKVNFFHYLIVIPLSIVIALPLLVPAVFVVTQVLHHPSIDFKSAP